MQSMKSRFSLSSAAVAVLTLGLTARAAVFSDFRFQGNLDSTGGSGPSLTDLGPSNGFTTATVDSASKTVFSFARGTGLSLDVSALPDKNLFTVVALFEFTGENSGGYERILQTKNFTTDVGLYWQATSLRFYSSPGGPTGVHQNGRFEQVVLVNDHGNLSGYADGVLQFSAVNDASVSSANLMHFFRDDVGEDSSGQVARLRLYDTALTSLEIAGLDRAAVPEPAEYAAVAGLALLAFGTWRRSRR